MYPVEWELALNGCYYWGVKVEKWDSLFDLWLGSTRGWRIRVGSPNAFGHHFWTCIDAINNIAYVQIGIGDEKQSG